jgi:hypothetical protein
MRNKLKGIGSQREIWDNRAREEGKDGKNFLGFASVKNATSLEFNRKTIPVSLQRIEEIKNDHESQTQY